MAFVQDLLANHNVAATLDKIQLSVGSAIEFYGSIYNKFFDQAIVYEL